MKTTMHKLSIDAPNFWIGKYFTRYKMHKYIVRFYVLIKDFLLN